MTFDPDQFIFLDMEASSLMQGSWPVEIGLSWIKYGNVETWSCLIRPHASWSMDYWSWESAEIHNIPVEELHAAPMAEDVAREAVTRIGNRIVLSDAPSFDQYWFNMLTFTAFDRQQKDIVTEDVLYSYPQVNMMAHMAYRERFSADHTHRAGDDARLMARCLQAAIL